MATTGAVPSTTSQTYLWALRLCQGFLASIILVLTSTSLAAKIMSSELSFLYIISSYPGFVVVWVFTAWTILYSLIAAFLPRPRAKSSLIVGILILDLLTAGMWLVAFTLLFQLSDGLSWAITPGTEMVASILISAVECLFFCFGAGHLIRVMTKNTNAVIDQNGNAIHLAHYPKQNIHGVAY
ncbi:hypothetical protein EDD37DRAFT_402050 [Exophiala viscosa]|uniref:MARVEL domain-containing protein n=1 Tax=Exophiala viscosa TaxID=2486360 RepID=A0AAN6DYG2_9EURO|nr:hypothetical protein EDD36DRAFT_169329 [Exophiala viscosa]KAI1624163.1 hypothetical protein EDD37DRAFT_402050 [Exophiala viscosa]